jgi:hypothetical protein
MAPPEPRVTLLAPFHSDPPYIVGRIEHPNDRLDVHHVGSQAGGQLLVLQNLAADVGVEPDKLA